MSQTNQRYSEAEIIAGLKNRDKKMLAYLYDCYGAALYGTAARIVNSDVYCEEVLQDAFLKIWKNIDKYDPKKGRLFTWMLRIVRNEAIDKQRSGEVQKSSKTKPIHQIVYAIDEKNSTTIKVDNIGIQDLLKHLDQADQQVLDLIYFQGYTHMQTAAALDMPLGTVKTKLRRALSKLRDVLIKE